MISTPTLLETRMVVHGRRGERAVVLLNDLLRQPVFETVAPGDAQRFDSRRPELLRTCCSADSPGRTASLRTAAPAELRLLANFDDSPL